MALLPSPRMLARIAGAFTAATFATTTLGAAASANPAAADNDPLIDINISLMTFDATDFLAKALELPAQLRLAVERDLDVSADQYLADAAAARSASNVLSALRGNGVDVETAVFDRETQSLEVLPADPADRAAIEATGATVLQAAPPRPEVPTDITPYAEYLGGYGYGQPDDTGRFTSYCSAGFNGHAADGSAVVLSAGHCFPHASGETPWAHVDVDTPWSVSTPGWPTPGEPLGVGVGGTWQFGGDHDLGLLRLDSPDWTPVPAVTTWNDDTTDDEVTDVMVTDKVAPVAGQPVCRSGITSGYHCGEILEVDHRVDYGDEYGNAAVVGFLTSACSAPGDSGGPFLSGTSAVGILSGASGPESGLCGEWDPTTHTSFAYALTGGEHSADAFYADGEWELSVAVATPEVSGPDPHGMTDTTPTISGSLAHGGPEHTVTVTIDGSVYSSPVDDSGTFSVPIQDELEPDDRYRYAIQAHYGQHSHSEVVEGAFETVVSDVADLVVSTPDKGQSADGARPTFSGTGEPGAEITLTVGADVYGDVTVGPDGTWELVPDADLPSTARFDAVVAQLTAADTQQVELSDLLVTVDDSAAKPGADDDGNEEGEDASGSSAADDSSADAEGQGGEARHDDASDDEAGNDEASDDEAKADDASTDGVSDDGTAENDDDNALPDTGLAMTLGGLLGLGLLAAGVSLTATVTVAKGSARST